MALFSGRSDDGVWEASARLPAGTWPVTFQATAAQGKNPTLAGPTLVVTLAPEPTAPPTPAPPPARLRPSRSRPRRLHRQHLPRRRHSPHPRQHHSSQILRRASSLPRFRLAGRRRGAAERWRERFAGRRGRHAGRRSTAGAEFRWIFGERHRCHSCSSRSPDSAHWSEDRVWFAVARRRRRRAPAPEPAPATFRPRARPDQPTRPARRPAAWELASLDDEPIGTVDYLGLQP